MAEPEITSDFRRLDQARSDTKTAVKNLTDAMASIGSDRKFLVEASIKRLEFALEALKSLVA
jgi:hypothetical protein